MTELQQLHQEREALRKQVRQQQMQIDESPNGVKKNMMSEAYDDGVNDGDVGGSQQRVQSHTPTPFKSKLPKAMI